MRAISEAHILRMKIIIELTFDAIQRCQVERCVPSTSLKVDTASLLSSLIPTYVIYTKYLDTPHMSVPCGIVESSQAKRLGRGQLLERTCTVMRPTSLAQKKTGYLTSQDTCSPGLRVMPIIYHRIYMLDTPPLEIVPSDMEKSSWLLGRYATGGMDQPKSTIVLPERFI